jgi:predicted RNA-binding Zn-ribbon protein involved in translation (DUF1610 family)
MVKIIQLMLLFLPLSIINLDNGLLAQNYTTESKSCGSCQKDVSINSKIGMTCPHCGVRWGYENEYKSNSYSNTIPSSYNNFTPSSYTTSPSNYNSTYPPKYSTTPSNYNSTYPPSYSTTPSNYNISNWKIDPSLVNPNKSIGFTSKNSNLRSSPSTSSTVKKVIPAYSNVSIISKQGNWYYVEYQFLDDYYNTKNLKGYVHYTLIK